MLDLIHKILYTGIGFAALTEQKAQEIVEELENRGEVSGEEGKKLAQELIDKAKKQSEHFRQTISDEVNKIADKCRWVSRKDIDELNARIEQLESRLAETPAQDSL
jgi:polyhydroxyalkanoate synthesis regulator phasin